jgi:hypothetical protein
MTNEIPKELIQSALALCWKSFEDMEEYSVWVDWRDSICWWEYEFSYPKFFYYLLSPEFMEKYQWNIHPAKNWPNSINAQLYRQYACEWIWKAIYEYQKGNSENLIQLLTKIWAK